MDERLKELRRSIKMIEDVLDYAYEGYVLVDNAGKVVMIQYEKLLGIKEEEAIGKPVEDIIENSRLHLVVKTGIEEIRKVQRIQGHDMITNRIPIMMDGEIIGGLGTILFKDIGEMKELAHNLLDLQSKINKYKFEIKRLEGVQYSFDNILTRNPQMNYLKAIGMKAAETNSTVLITGESGTGKELFAQAIHKASYRNKNPFIAINCGAIPKGLIESELFGYIEGAFTGASDKGKTGKFELASGGTLFLDEIGNMPVDMQVKLLRVLETREFEAIGSNKKLKLDARIIAATNENLEEQVELGNFREDLYYRLNVISIDIPPLKDRLEDLDMIAENIIEKLSEEMSLEKKALSDETMSVLKSYNWPGNVRELRNVLERAINLSSTEYITPNDISERVLYKTKNHKYINTKVGNKTLQEIVEETEKEAILSALEICKGNKTKVSELLNIHRNSLYQKMRKYNIM